jgi:hypothetical protein
MVFLQIRYRSMPALRDLRVLSPAKGIRAETLNVGPWTTTMNLERVRSYADAAGSVGDHDGIPEAVSLFQVRHLRRPLRV